MQPARGGSEPLGRARPLTLIQGQDEDRGESGDRDPQALRPL